MHSVCCQPEQLRHYSAMRKLRQRSLLCMVRFTPSVPALSSTNWDLGPGSIWQRDKSTSADYIFEIAVPATKQPSFQMMIPLINGALTQFQATNTVSGLLPVSSVMISVTTLGVYYLVLRSLLRTPARQ
jgi:hypothetical protein